MSANISATAVEEMADRLLGALVPDAHNRSGAAAQIVYMHRLNGGANKETWSCDLVSDGDSEPLILRRVPGVVPEDGALEAVPGDLGIADEAALIAVVGRYDVPVPAVRHVLRTEDALGLGYVMSRESGEALPFRLLADERYKKARENLAFQCGQILGRIHQVPLESLPAGLPDHSGAQLFQRAQELLDTHGNVSPVLQLALNWLRDNARPAPGRSLVHGDFRNGNLLVDEHGLVAVLDWELAHLGDPVLDLGYISANVWRFGASPPVGGFGEYTDLLAGYESVTGAAPAMQEIYYWQVHAALSWGMVCLIMLEQYRSGQDSSLERAAVGRRLSEAEVDLLLLLEGEYP
jgi:aminoglycoside phosphotransferase (APT) family kinase protein